MCTTVNRFNNSNLPRKYPSLLTCVDNDTLEAEYYWFLVY